MVAVGGEGRGERAIDRLPRGEVLGRALHLAFTAFGAEITAHPAARRWQGARAVGPQQVGQFALYDDAGAARLHRTGDALVDLHVEAYPAGTVTLPCEERERSTPYGFSNRRDGLAPRGHRRGA